MTTISKRVRIVGLAATVVLAAAGGLAAVAQTPQPRVEKNGTVHTPNVWVPVSTFLSPQGQAALNERLHRQREPGVGIAGMRAVVREGNDATAKRWLAVHPADIAPVTLGGVAAETIIPKGGVSEANRERVLINLHGGGFLFGAVEGGRVESIPMAGVGRIKVVSVDYRMAPEYRFPAASEDVAAVYRELLKTYKPANIGIYGCSAGGALAGQAVAWIAAQGLPRPGAVGVFCSGLMPGMWRGGDSGAFSAISNAPPRPAPAGASALVGDYFKGGKSDDPLMSPALSPAVLAKFPPTLLLTGSRDVALSNMLVTHMRLRQAGVDASLIVQEGMGHGDFNSYVGTPEATYAWDQAWAFFDAKLGR